ncbi:hypothetical protein BH11CYA1_BH11CYA1_03370 [soil metagenome]
MTVTKEKTTTTKTRAAKAKAVKATANSAVLEPSSVVVETVSVVSEPVSVVLSEVAAEAVLEVVSVPAVEKATVSLAQVAQRAYEIWQASGCEHGRDAEHWLAAEHELKH